MDPSSLANITQVQTQHLHLDVEFDFARSVVTGSVELTLVAVAEVSEVLLDARDLRVFRVVEANAELAHEPIAAATAVSGSGLRIRLGAAPRAAGSVIRLRVDYETSPSSSGIKWLPPSQTEGKKHPYVFTQFEPFHARSGLPCQDSPAVKTRYTARLVVPEALTALMSALAVGEQHGRTALQGSGKAAFSFEQRVPIPTYLIAFVVGALESREIGPRSRVWSEAARVEAAAHEFADTETFLRTAEELLCPYEWGRYDLLVLPGSFPYGGMENPCLTFVTPTLLAGDRSLADVVAHEIAHSWTGNLVTNRTWEHFWLNEGFTVFVERKILGRMHGEKYRHFHAIIGWKALKDSVDEQNGRFCSLVHRLDIDTDPDDAFSSVPYERGFEFLFYLEALVGGADKFEPFLRRWVVEHKYQTVTSDQFQTFFLAHFKDEPAVAKIDWNAWYHGQGMPPVDVLAMFDQTLATASRQLAARWLAEEGATAAAAADVDGWSSPQLVLFLETLLLAGGEKRLAPATLQKMDAAYKLTASRNSEVRFRWYRLCIASQHAPIFPDVVAFLREQGRMKFTRPLYRDLFKAGGAARDLAVATFKDHRDNYHSICSKMVAQDLGLAE